MPGKLVADLAGTGNLAIDERRIFVIRAGKNRYGKPRWGKRWHVQFALAEIFKETGLPQYVSNWEELTRQVNGILKSNPDYLYEEVDPMTVSRAFQDLKRR